MADLEKRLEALEAMLRGPSGEELEELETHRRLYDALKRHKIEGGDVPGLSSEERVHWDRLEIYHGIALRVAAGREGAA